MLNQIIRNRTQLQRVIPRLTQYAARPISQVQGNISLNRPMTYQRIVSRKNLMGMTLRQFSSAESVNLPDLGEGTKEATIKEWFVKPGDRVEEFDDLVEVFTDKLVAKIPSTVTGTVQEISYEEDDVCLVGHSLLKIVPDGQEVAQPAAAVPAPTQQAPQTPVATDAVQAASGLQPGPAVRNLAKKHNIDINQVPATGKGGRVTKEDILNFQSGKTSAVQAQPVATDLSEKTTIVQQQKLQPQYMGAPLTGITEQDKVKKITGMKRAMTKTMTQSLSVPTFTNSDDIDATALIKLRKDLKKNYKDLTMLPFFIKALSLAMNEYPLLNTIVDPEVDEEGYIKKYVLKHDHNYAVAIDSAEGLTTPIIKGVNHKSIMQINSDLRDLVFRTQNNQLTRDDFEGGSFSVSSVGNIGGKYFVPTILRPHAAIIAIGKAHKSPKYIEGEGDDYKWEAMDRITFSITADHRIVDGATCLRFCGKFKDFIENPNMMMINM